MSYFETKNKKDCNGCGACALRCPKKAIDMIEDEEGFLYPEIDLRKCINCGLCKKICSNFPSGIFETKSFIAINKNQNTLLDSTSGGVFSVISETILKK